MKLKLKIILIICLTGGLFDRLTASAPHPFFNRHAEGWHFYESLDQSTSESVKQKEENTERQEPLTPTEIIKAQKQELERLLHEALVSPTMANIAAYQALQQRIVKQGQMFAHAWARSLLFHPEFDETVLNPVNQTGSQLASDMKVKNRAGLFEMHKKSWGLFYFFKGNCGYCKLFSGVLKNFSKKHGWKILGVSLDGSACDGLETRPDNGLAQKLQISSVPALWMVNPTSGQMLPLVYGFHTLDEVEERIELMLTTSQTVSQTVHQSNSQADEGLSK